MDAERRAYHDRRFAEAKRIATLAFFHHEIFDTRDGPFCSRCGIALDTPKAMLSPCQLAPKCSRCGNLGIIKVAVSYRPTLDGRYTPFVARLPCPSCWEFIRALEEEYWAVVGETLVEPNRSASKLRVARLPPKPTDTTGVA